MHIHEGQLRAAGALRMITISAFRWVPPFARGQVRDLRVRWALEEADLPYWTRRRRGLLVVRSGGFAHGRALICPRALQGRMIRAADLDERVSGRCADRR